MTNSTVNGVTPESLAPTAPVVTVTGDALIVERAQESAKGFAASDIAAHDAIVIAQSVLRGSNFRTFEVFRQAWTAGYTTARACVAATADVAWHRFLKACNEGLAADDPLRIKKPKSDAPESEEKAKRRAAEAAKRAPLESMGVPELVQHFAVAEAAARDAGIAAVTSPSKEANETAKTAKAEAARIEAVLNAKRKAEADAAAARLKTKRDAIIALVREATLEQCERVLALFATMIPAQSLGEAAAANADAGERKAA